MHKTYKGLNVTQEVQINFCSRKFVAWSSNIPTTKVLYLKIICLLGHNMKINQSFKLCVKICLLSSISLNDVLSEL